MSTSAQGCWCEDGKHGISGPLPAREFTPAFRIYDLRHTYVTLQLMAGVPVNVVADRAGPREGVFYHRSLRPCAAETAARGNGEVGDVAVQDGVIDCRV